MPPPAPAKIPKEQHAEVASMRGVSQATIWRIVRRATGREEAGVAGTIGA